MRSKFVIFICLFNTLLVSGLLWFIFKPVGRKETTKAQVVAPSRESLDNTQLWINASKATSPQEARFYLNRIADKTKLKEEVRNIIKQQLSSNTPNIKQWSFYQAVLSTDGQLASTHSELTELAEIVSNKSAPLTFRNTAFRVYIENWLRLKGETNDTAPVYELIDQLYEEPNSLSETSLEAEHFLNNNIPSRERQLLFKQRLIENFQDQTKPETMRITALKILSETKVPLEHHLGSYFVDADRSLKTAILKTIITTKPAAPSLTWLQSINPETPEQEQLIQQILMQK
jgi:hypothetical protein